MINEFVYPLRIHIEDTDYGGVVYHSRYINFMERARSEWMLMWGIDMQWQKAHQVHFVVHSANMRFIRPAKVHELVEVVTKVSLIKPASIIYDQHLRHAGSPDKILCEATIKIACVGDDLRPTVLPPHQVFDDLRRMLS